MKTETIAPAAKPEKPQKTTKLIEKLLADYNRFSTHAKEHQELLPRCQKEKAELLPTVRLDDKESVARLSDLNMRLDMLPGIIKQFQTAADTAKDNLAEECQAVTATLLKVIEDKFSTLRAQMTAALGPFFPKRDKDLIEAERTISRVTFGSVDDVESAVNDICVGTIPGATLIKIKARLKSESFISRNVFKKAAELIEFGAVIDALKIVDNAKI
ncbi:MAG: hypothetical protein ABSF34_12250 [Verrucomicrobiota bacterium]